MTYKVGQTIFLTKRAFRLERIAGGYVVMSYGGGCSVYLSRVLAQRFLSQRKMFCVDLKLKGQCRHIEEILNFVSTFESDTPPRKRRKLSRSWDRFGVPEIYSPDTPEI
jgi:hypothetical protein